MDDRLQRIEGHKMEAWKRKLIDINGSFYVNLPMPIMKAYGKRKGSVVEFQRVFDEKSGRLLVVIEL